MFPPPFLKPHYTVYAHVQCRDSKKVNKRFKFNEDDRALALQKILLFGLHTGIVAIGIMDRGSNQCKMPRKTALKQSKSSISSNKPLVQCTWVIGYMHHCTCIFIMTCSLSESLSQFFIIGHLSFVTVRVSDLVEFLPPKVGSVQLRIAADLPTSRHYTLYVHYTVYSTFT